MKKKRHAKKELPKKPHKKLNVLRLRIILSALFLILVVVLIIVLKHNKEDKVCFKYTCFTVEVVDTPKEREQGLMFRTQLDESSGMLFVFEQESTYPFWMKNTYLPLDMIWINSSKQVSYIFANATMCGEGNCPPIYPNASAKYVLEINAGLAEFYSIKVGDKVIID
jgi:uncharacterized protein